MDIEEATKEAIKACEALAEPKCSAKDYLAALQEVQEYLEVCIDAAKGDVARAKGE